MRRADKSSPLRFEALERGERKYFTGNACAQGHVSERYSVSGACVKCMSLNNARTHRAASESRKVYMRERGKVARKNKGTWAAEVLRVAKARAQKIGLAFDISPEDIETPEFCPVLGVKIIYDAYHPRSHRPSLDRKDNSKGYIRGNVSVISCRANQIKNDAGSKELELVLAYVKRIESGENAHPAMLEIE